MGVGALPHISIQISIQSARTKQNATGKPWRFD
jgi:hypothetical protein